MQRQPFFQAHNYSTNYTITIHAEYIISLFYAHIAKTLSQDEKNTNYEFDKLLVFLNVLHVNTQICFSTIHFHFLSQNYIVCTYVQYTSTPTFIFVARP